jgi:hypothetical protein
MVGEHEKLEKNIIDASANFDGVTGTMKKVKTDMQDFSD